MNLQESPFGSNLDLTIIGSDHKVAVQQFSAQEAVSGCYAVNLWLASKTITSSQTLKNDGSEPYVGKLCRIVNPGESLCSLDEVDLMRSR